MQDCGNASALAVLQQHGVTLYTLHNLTDLQKNSAARKDIISDKVTLILFYGTNIYIISNGLRQDFSY